MLITLVSSKNIKKLNYCELFETFQQKYFSMQIFYNYQIRFQILLQYLGEIVKVENFFRHMNTKFLPPKCFYNQNLLEALGMTSFESNFYNQILLCLTKLLKKLLL